MNNLLDKQLKRLLDERVSKNALRQLSISDNLIDFSSNDYLGLAQSNKPTIDTGIDELRKNGATGSRLLRGNSRSAENLESSLASWYRAPAALVFNSGYTANLGFFSTLPKRGDTILYDQYCHASIRDGIRLSNARAISFKHNDCQDFRRKLEGSLGNVFVIVESVYSMDGDEAPLKELASICTDKGAYLVVDEAHAFGVFGEKGAGLCIELGIEDSCFARVITFGKAAGAHGAAILGGSILKDYLINYCRSFIYTTALPPHAYEIIGSACIQLQHADVQRKALNSLVQQLNAWKVSHPDIPFIPARSAIQCLLLPGNDRVRSLAQRMQREGFDLRAIVSPTVPEGTERLRICLHSFNTVAELTRLLAGIERFFPKFEEK